MRISYFGLLCLITILSYSCNNNQNSSSNGTIYTGDTSSNNSNSSSSTTNSTVGTQSTNNSLPSEIVGTLFGTQAPYAVRNSSGKEIIVNGNPVLTSSSNYTFTIQADGNVYLTQENGDSRYSYAGQASVIENNSVVIKLECNLKLASGGSTESNPTYTLTLSKSSNTITCSNPSEPDLILTKQESSATQSQQDGNASQQNYRNNKTESIDGTYSFSDGSVKARIVISGNTWSGQTIIVSGISSDNDQQNAEYQNGSVSGNTLYDESGYAEVGHVSGRYLNTSIGGQSLTLTKD